MKKLDLKKFKQILLEKRYLLVKNMQEMEESTLRRHGSGDLTNIPTHMADISADTFEQHLNLDLLENEAGVIREITEALERIEDGSFGKCEECENQIAPKRLEYVPYAKLCISCKKKEEERSEEYWQYY